MKVAGALWKGFGILFGASVTLLPMVPLVSLAADPMCVFVSQKGTAWVVRKDLSVKTSLRVGDYLYPGDQVIVMHGNTVHLAFDKDLQNIVQIEGESLLQLVSSNPLNIELYKGKVFAVINKKTLSSQFRISTPAAIASVRGTRYEVTHSDEEGSKVFTYEGSVEVAGRRDGKETKEVVMVRAGEKTTVKAPGIAPQPAQPMTAREKIKAVGMMSAVDVAKNNFSKQGPSDPINLNVPKMTPTPASSPKAAKSPEKEGKTKTTQESKGDRIFI